MNIRKLFAAVKTAVNSFRSELNSPEVQRPAEPELFDTNFGKVSVEELQKIVDAKVAGQMVNAGFTPPDIDGNGEGSVVLPEPVEDFAGEVHPVAEEATTVAPPVIEYHDDMSHPSYAQCAEALRQGLARQITDNPCTLITAFGLDDLDMFEAALIIEEQFNTFVPIPDEVINNATTLGELYNYLVGNPVPAAVVMPSVPVDTEPEPEPQVSVMENITNAVVAAGVDPDNMTVNDRVAAYLEKRPGKAATLKQVQSTLRRYGNFTVNSLYVMLEDDSRFCLGARDWPLSTREVWLDNQ